MLHTDVGNGLYSELAFMAEDTVTDFLGNLLLTLFMISGLALMSLPIEGALAQQAYGGNELFDCNIKYSGGSASGYVCNGAKKRCQTYALFYAHPPVQSLFNISRLFNLDLSRVAAASNLSRYAELKEDQAVLIPLNCNCINNHSQVNGKYKIHDGDTYFIVTQILEGLTSCQALQEQNPSLSSQSLVPGDDILIPIRCACPTVVQMKRGVRYLLSYAVHEGDTLHKIAQAFNISSDDIMIANQLEGADGIHIFAYASLLIPLKNKPVIHPSFQRYAEAVAPSPRISSSAVTSTSKRKRSSKIGIYIGISAGMVALIFVIVGAFFLSTKWKNIGPLNGTGSLQCKKTVSSPRAEDDNNISISTKNMTIKNAIVASVADLIMTSYTFQELREATDNFSPDCRVEGSVFHGVLNGTSVAIKQTRGEISKEFEILHKVHHANIIALFGICFGGADHSYLVFEYAENGSLSDWLHGGLAMKNKFISSCSCFLTWNQRLHICLDVARGLQYIHKYTEPSYVHKDLKSSNVLLNAEFKAKIANFGMAKTSENADKMPLFTRHISGTHGYMAPEYIAHGLVTPEIDIFAYGVLLLEILSGQPPIIKGSNKGGKALHLAQTVGPLLESCHDNSNQALKDWMDPTLDAAYSMDQALTLAKLAKSCVDEDSSLRPTTDDITVTLLRLVETASEAEMLWDTTDGQVQGR